jgi:aminopeptidase N
MTNQEIYKKLVAIYLMIDNARSELEELETDARNVELDDDEEDISPELGDLAATAEQLAIEIEDTGEVKALIEEAYS